MFCRKCGVTNPDEAQVCSACGNSLEEVVLPPAPPIPVAPPQQTVYSGYAGPQTVYGGAPFGDPYQGPPQTSGKAVASLILSLLPCLAFGIAAVVFGHISRSEIRRSAGRLKGDGLALAGLIIGYLQIAFVPFVLIAVIAIPNLLKARMAANEASAVGGVRRIVAAEMTYAESQKEYTCDLTALNLNDGNLGRGLKSGYIYNLSDCSATGFKVEAVPVKADNTGRRAFCADESGVIRYELGGGKGSCTTDSQALE